MRPEPIPPLTRPGRKAPPPTGPLTGRRTWWRRFGARGSAALNRALDLLPPGRWLHRRAQRGLSLSDVEIPMGRGHGHLGELRIAFLSDLHAGSFMSELDLCRVFEKVAAREPHLVCFGGDLINTREREILLYRRPLQILAPPLGIHAVPGNHDHFWGRDIGLWSSFLQDQGVHVLLNRGHRLSHGDGGLWVCGVDDLTEGEPSLAHALDGHDPEDPVLLLSHHPDFFFEAAAVGVDLTLSGHTHGGQIRLFGKAPVRHSKFGYEQGLFSEEGSHLYVGRGVGVTLLPLRIGAPPEIPIFSFKLEP